MSLQVLARYTILLLIAVVVCFFAMKSYQRRHDVGTLVLVKILIAATFIFGAATISILPFELPWWLMLLRTALVHYSLLIAYLATRQMLSEKPFRQSGWSKIVLAVVPLSTINLLLDIARRDDLRAFVDNEPISPSAISYISPMLYHSILLILALAFVLLYWKSLRWRSELSFVVRRLMCLIAFAVAAFSMLAVEINLLLSLLGSESYRADLNQIYHASKIIIFFLLVLAFVIPRSVLAVLMQPLEYALRRRRQRHEALLRYLHGQMIQIVPRVCLQNELLRDVRALIEISDARQIIWSQELRTDPITPMEEAEALFLLLCSGTVINEPGAYPPPATRDRNVMKHNLAVAKQLQQLERYAGRSPLGQLVTNAPRKA